MRFEELFDRREQGKLSVEAAADMLGINERTFRRWCERYREEGEEGLSDRRLGQAAYNAAPVDEVLALLNLYETRYPNFNGAHFYDKWRDKHGGERSYTWVKKQLQTHGLLKQSKKRGTHRRRRPRQPLPGMMLHQDGSSHEWVPGEIWDLIVTLDDATSTIYSAFFVEEEGTWSSFRGVKEVIESKGLFCSFYTDRGSHYWHTPKAGGKVDKSNPTQFGRAMQKLGIEMIAAYSPEARGRSERVFGTLQGCLPQELALAGISEMEAANAYLAAEFLPAYNRKFAVEAKEEGSAFIEWLPGNLSLADILCIQEQRTVNKDNTVQYKGKILQIAANRYRCHYIKAKVTVHEYANGELRIFYGPRCIGCYSETPIVDGGVNLMRDAA